MAATRLIRKRGLPMKVVAVDHVPDDDRPVLYFTSPHRVDVRALVRDPGATLRVRVELRQLSARDYARCRAASGPAAATLNPMRISGACGRLMCCLKYGCRRVAVLVQPRPSVRVAHGLRELDRRRRPGRRLISPAARGAAYSGPPAA